MGDSSSNCNSPSLSSSSSSSNSPGLINLALPFISSVPAPNNLIIWWKSARDVAMNFCTRKEDLENPAAYRRREDSLSERSSNRRRVQETRWTHWAPSTYLYIHLCSSFSHISPLSRCCCLIFPRRSTSSIFLSVCVCPGQKVQKKTHKKRAQTEREGEGRLPISFSQCLSSSHILEWWTRTHTLFFSHRISSERRRKKRRRRKRSSAMMNAHERSHAHKKRRRGGKSQKERYITEAWMIVLARGISKSKGEWAREAWVQRYLSDAARW